MLSQYKREFMSATVSALLNVRHYILTVQRALTFNFDLQITRSGIRIICAGFQPNECLTTRMPDKMPCFDRLRRLTLNTVALSKISSPIPSGFWIGKDTLNLASSSRSRGSVVFAISLTPLLPSASTAAGLEGRSYVDSPVAVEI